MQLTSVRPVRSMRIGMSLTAAILLAVLCSSSAEAQAGNGTTIRRITSDSVAGTITIHGRNFCFNPVVSISTTVLEVLSVELGEGADSVTAAVPADTGPAGYRLTLDCGVDRKGRSIGDEFDLGGGGAVGEMGPPGPRGEVGPEGDTGPAGPAGADGDTGPAGPAGADGADGATGPAGADGATGATGPAGADGATGATGPEGAPGLAEVEIALGSCRSLCSLCITSFIASCPAGKTAIGGGVGIYNDAACTQPLFAGKMASSRRLDASNWKIGLENDNAFQEIYVQAEAVCATVQ